MTSVIRSKHCITLVRGWPHRNVQVILRLYRSKGEVLIGFDIDACAVGPYTPDCQSDKIFHIDMGYDRIDTDISHIIRPYPRSISR